MISTRIRTGIGVSDLPEAEEAGRTAATAALDHLHGEPAALILVYASVRYDLSSLLAGIRSVTGDVPLIGSTSSGQFHGGSFVTPGTAVSVLALTAGPYRFGIAVAEGLSADAQAAGMELARAARQAAGPDLPRYAALLLLTDGLTGDHQLVLTGMYRVTGAAVPVVGGAASDDFRFAGTYVLHNDRILADAAVAVWIASERPLAVVTYHGWTPISLPLLVTQTDGHVVHEIAGRPALEVYQEHVQVDPNDSLKTPGVYVPEHATHALGLVEPDGSVLIRAAMIGKDGELRTFAPLPDYAAVQIVSCHPDDLLDASDEVVSRALQDHDASVLLAFSCVARLTILGDRVGQEAARMQAIANDVPTFGFYTYGEFARTTSVSGFHNASVSAIAL